MQMVGPSHPYHLVIRPGNIAEWRFDDIQLPDSSSNEPASHGFVTYRVKPYGGLVQGTALENTAYISLNAASSVSTNTTLNVIDFTISIDPGRERQFSIYPNPTEGMLYVNLGDHAKGECVVSIFNTQGMLLNRSTISSPEAQVDLSGFAEGMYLLKIEAEGKALGFAKVFKSNP